MRSVLELMTENLALRRAQHKADPKAQSTAIIERAYEDAKLLAADHLAGLPTSRRYSPLPERRWRVAVALAVLAGVYEAGQGFTSREPDHLAGALAMGRQRALDNPPRLLTRLPKSRTPKRFYPRW